jgi:hypothetical protein
MQAMKLTIDRILVGTLLEHAAAAARLVGEMSDADDALAEHADTIVHHLSEVLGDPLAVPRAAACDRPSPATNRARLTGAPSMTDVR